MPCQEFPKGRIFRPSYPPSDQALIRERIGGYEEELVAYREALRDEIRAHRNFFRVTILTGFGLLIGGILILNYYTPLGWLLVLVGTIRGLNSLYDIQREDMLKKKLRELEERFGGGEESKAFTGNR